MKKIVSLLMTVIIALCANAQKDVTKFLGIPVDGSKTEMIQKLKAKGFRTSLLDKDVLTGEFNGMDVNIHIVTNGDKVWRIAVNDAIMSDERSIQIRFNNLCRQFEQNPKYTSFGNEIIPDNEDIGYEIMVNNKRYEANFSQTPKYEKSDTASMLKTFMPLVLSKYTEEELANPTEEIRNDLMRMSVEYAFELFSKKHVWFMISNHYASYFISMFYDNEYNHANGEDL